MGVRHILWNAAIIAFSLKYVKFSERAINFCTLITGMKYKISEKV